MTDELTVPTIGIGAGVGCDGQVLVLHDMLGLNEGFQPRFLRRFASTVTVLHEGKLLCEGTVEQVRTDPRVREVYLGRSRQNGSRAAVGVDEEG